MTAVATREAPVRRPLVRWLGSKWRMAPWIIEQMPPHEVYVEPFGGSASVLIRKPRARMEVLCDADAELLCLYSVLRDPALCGRLAMLCMFTPFSDAEFRVAMIRLPEGSDTVERARRMVVRHAMQVSPDVRGEKQGTGYRRYTGPGHCAAHDWSTFNEALADITARLMGVVVEGGDAMACMLRHDRPAALHYVDPPYVHSTRREARKGYSHELTDADHVRLLDGLLGLEGMVMVSGYASPLYDDALVGWRRVTRQVSDHARRLREEVLWISPRAVAASIQKPRTLFD